MKVLRNEKLRKIRASRIELKKSEEEMSDGNDKVIQVFGLET